MSRQTNTIQHLLVLAIVAITATKTSGQILVDDFEDGVDDGWWHFLSGEGESWGPGIFDASSGTYHLTTTALVPPGEAGALNSYWSASAAPFYRDGFWHATVRAEPGGTNVGLIVRGGHSPGGYLVTTTLGGQLDIYDCKRTNCRILARSVQVGESPGFSQGEDWIMEVSAVGDMISGKMWQKGEPEPEQPHVSVQDTTYATGQFGVSGFVGGAWTQPDHTDAYFDDIYFTPVDETRRGDFNGSGDLDAEDIDLLTTAITDEKPGPQFDLNSDQRIDTADRQVWVHDISNTYFGDSNLDGEFNSIDFVAVFAAGQYEDDIPLNSGWATGDWDGDADFTTADLVVAFQDGGYEQGPRAAAVPEPSALRLLVLGCLSCITLPRVRLGQHRRRAGLRK